MNAKDQKHYAAGYQAALADIQAVMEEVDPEYGGLHVIQQVEKWIENNSTSLSGTYRGYWIEHTKGNGTDPVFDCFDIYLDNHEVASGNRIECVTNIGYAKKLIDDWKRAK